MEQYKGKKISREEFARRYGAQSGVQQRVSEFFERYGSFACVCLLCSEPTVDQCHRGVLTGQLLARSPQLSVLHL